MKTCKNVMTNDPVCCVPEETVDKAAQLMKLEDIGSVPVVESFDSYKLVGIVTDRDLAVEVVAADRDPADTRIGEVMKQEVITCKESDDIQKALDAMAKHQVRRIPIVTRDNRVVGIIAQGDVATRLHEPERTGEIVAKISK